MASLSVCNSLASVENHAAFILAWTSEEEATRSSNVDRLFALKRSLHEFYAPAALLSNPARELSNPAEELSNPAGELSNPARELSNPAGDLLDPAVYPSSFKAYRVSIIIGFTEYFQTVVLQGQQFH